MLYWGGFDSHPAVVARPTRRAACSLLHEERCSSHLRLKDDDA